MEQFFSQRQGMSVCIRNMLLVWLSYACCSKAEARGFEDAVDEVIFEQLGTNYNAISPTMVEHQKDVRQCLPVNMCSCSVQLRMYEESVFTHFAASYKYCGIMGIKSISKIPALTWNLQVPHGFSLIITFQKLLLPIFFRCSFVNVALHYGQQKDIFCGRYGKFSKSLSPSTAVIKFMNLFHDHALMVDILITYQAGGQKVENHLHQTCLAKSSANPTGYICNYLNQHRGTFQYRIVILTDIYKYIILSHRPKEPTELTIHDGPSPSSPKIKSKSTAFVLLIYCTVQQYQNLTDQVRYKTTAQDIASHNQNENCSPGGRKIISSVRSVFQSTLEDFSISIGHRDQSETTLCLWLFDENMLQINEKLFIDNLAYQGPEHSLVDVPGHSMCHHGGMFVFGYRLDQQGLPSQRLFWNACRNVRNVTLYNFIEEFWNFYPNQGLLVLAVWFGGVSSGELHAT